MANLRVNKITGTEVFETTGSVQFDGTGDVLTVPNTADFRLGSGDFTLECFMYYVGPLSSNRTLFGLFENSSARRSYQLEVRSTGVLRFEWWPDGSTSNAIDSPASTITSGQWSHIAVVRNGSVITVYLNGSSVATSNVGTSSFYENTVDSFRIGALNAAVDQSFSGHISNVRVIKGTALYTKNFTPPTRELTVIPNTVLLCCQSTTRANEERTGKTITVNGNAVANELTPGLLTDRIKSGGSSAISGSVEFNGSSSTYLTVSSSDFAIGTGDFTVEGWVYQSGGDTTYGGMFSSQLSNNTGIGIAIARDQIWVGNNGTSYGSISSTFWDLNQWTHVALTRSGTSLRAFRNGILVGTDTSTGNIDRQNAAIGRRYYDNTSFILSGFISNLRVIKGTALYTQNFIPPTRELKRLPGTVLLCCQNSKSATQEATGKTITVNGNATARNFTPSVGFDGFVNFDGVTKIKSSNYFYLPTGTTEDRGRGRGVFTISSGTPTNSNAINYLQISSSGNSQDFGDLTSVSGSAGSVSSSTRMIIALGNNSPVTPSPGNVNTLDYLTIATTSNTLDFGDLTTRRGEIPGVSNSTRGVFIGGLNELVSPYSGPTISYTNTMDYVTIASLGNAIDFGDAHSDAVSHASAVGNTTRGVYTVSWNSSTTVNNINYITFSTTGNGQDFGDLITPQNRQQKGSVSNSTRGLFAGGISPVTINTIEYVTITSLGNAQDFGDLSYIRRDAGGTSNSIRGVFAGGYDAPPGPLGRTDVIDYVILASTGNASDFGDLPEKSLNNTGASDSHGGLG